MTERIWLKSSTVHLRLYKGGWMSYMLNFPIRLVYLVSSVKSSFLPELT